MLRHLPLRSGGFLRATQGRSERGMRAGGFGILLSQGLVDELIYNEKGNEVVLIKYLKEE